MVITRNDLTKNSSGTNETTLDVISDSHFVIIRIFTSLVIYSESGLKEFRLLKK